MKQEDPLFKNELRQLLIDMAPLFPGPLRYTAGRKYVADDDDLQVFLEVSEPFIFQYPTTFQGSGSELLPVVQVEAKFMATPTGNLFFNELKAFADARRHRRDHELILPALQRRRSTSYDYIIGFRVPIKPAR